MLRALALIALLAVTLPPRAGLAQEVQVDVELLLLVDVSLSMTPGEIEIQRRGYAAALETEAVAAAIRGGMIGRIALAYVEWAGSQRVVIGWTVLEGAEDIRAFARDLRRGSPRGARRTSISGALDFGSGYFEVSGVTGLRRVIDISGDGPNNLGRPVTQARDAALARGITVNGLPLMTTDGWSQWSVPDLDRYYADCVVGGPGAFVVPVHDWEDLAAAVERKLVLEISGRQPAPRLVRAQAGAPADCMLGERIWRERYRGP